MSFKELQWRDLSFDYYESLSEIQCATPNPNSSFAEQYGSIAYLPWEWEVQRAFMSIPWVKDDEKDHIRIAIRWLTLVEDELVGACWIRVIDGTWYDNQGHYHISAIARNLHSKGTNLGWFILQDALEYIRSNSKKTGKPPLVVAYVDYRNEPCISLFRRAGFETEDAIMLVDNTYRIFSIDLDEKHL